LTEERIFNRSSATLFFSIFMVGIGFSIIMPILPYYAESMGASAFQLGLLMTVYALCQFIFAPFWGSYSDRVGRKPVLLVGMFGFTLTFYIFALANSLWVLFVARIAGGALSCATVPTAMAVMGDTSSPEKRGAGMGMVGASMGMGMIFGPAIGSGLAHISLAAPFVVAGSLSLLICFCILFLVKESLPVEDRVSEAQKIDRAPLLKGLKSPLAFLFTAMFLASMAEATNMGTFALFAEGKLGFGPTSMGLIFSCAGLASVLVQGFVVGRSINKWGEEKTSGAGIILMAASFALFLQAKSLLELIIYMGIFSAGTGLIRPSISAATSKRTTGSQGTAMGVLQGYDSLGRVIGPSLGGYLLDMNLSYAYISAIFFSGLAFITLLFNRSRGENKEHEFS